MSIAKNNPSSPLQYLRSLSSQWWGQAVVLVLVLGWAYGAELLQLADRWWSNPDYIHGFLVIPFACYLAWRRRDMLSLPSTGRNASMWGMGLVFVAILMRCASAYMSDPVFGPISLIPCLMGMSLVLGGWKTARWLWPSLVFLVFMVPLPNFMESWGNLVLQRGATLASTAVLQTMGVPAASFGNIILLTNAELGVEEACSGLRSTVLFFAVSVGAALMLNTMPERIAVLLSAVPAALIANIIRIVATGLLYQYASTDLAEAVFHDFFGFLMLPLAAGMVWCVVRLTQAVLIPVDEDGPLSMAPMSPA